MPGTHVTQHLSAYLHNELPPDRHAQVGMHLQECARCRSSYDEIKFGARMASLLKPSSPPESMWADLHSRKSRTIFRLPQIAATAAAVLVVAALSGLIGARLPQEEPKSAEGWIVESVRGTPRIENTAISGAAELRAGETLQTDAASQAEVRIASIGKLTIEPNSKIRLLITKTDEHRIALDHGKVEALTWAPPRLFIVDTPSARAVDLGCMYTLDVQTDGSSLLHVTLGMVSLASHGRESFVPAYNYAHSRPHYGPGTPFHEESSEQFKAALDLIDFGRDKPDTRQLDLILSEARERDAATLWHLLSRIDAAERGKVYDHLARFVEPPKSVTREGVLSLDAQMLRTWGEAIPALWWMTR
jgi:hypothetical protein